MKWRLFRHLTGGGDPGAERAYRWHIALRRRSGFVDGAKPDVEAFVPLAGALLLSMQNFGYHKTFPIPVDPNGDILGGAHRLACAIALGIPAWIEPRPERAWAPAWGLRWFMDRDFPDDDVKRLVDDWKRMKE